VTRPAVRIAQALILVLVSSAGCVSIGSHPVPGRCESAWWKYVYSPERLAIHEPCVTVRGVVLEVRHPIDADAVVFLKPDPEYARYSSGDRFELEIVCKHPLFRFFVFRCWSCVNRIQVPRTGDHIEADGFYVEDLAHRHMEIHPVTRITVLRN
jgi:hypothetical protein